jgi:hypothetical protein
MSVHWHTIWTVLFGWPGTWGAGGNMVAWVICGVISFGWLRAKMRAHHVAQLAQAARHQKELRDQAEAHHLELRRLAEKHHLQALDRLEAHHEALKAHVTSAIGTRKVTRSG